MYLPKKIQKYFHNHELGLYTEASNDEIVAHVFDFSDETTATISSVSYNPSGLTVSGTSNTTYSINFKTQGVGFVDVITTFSDGTRRKVTLNVIEDRSPVRQDYGAAWA